MNRSSVTDLPRLILVTGRPGSGKSSLTHALAHAIGCQPICRDELKEELIRSARGPSLSDSAANQLVYDLFFDAIAEQLGRGIHVLAEAAFQHKLWVPRLTPLLSLASTRIIVCHVSSELARSRRIARAKSDPQRERFHPDEVVRADQEGRALPVGEYDPPHLGVPTLTVDTSDGYVPCFEQVVTFAKD